ncbi:hypothetical protein JDV02_010833 [Purpureocillium takamizusanense]|uniref:Uncharacterized protein n=1 Tax=Purpureocillium takamizusanense TaxID=2060973 RepID=A0A9Q8Q8S2_9HYPO|nr:uncharacterized protein JDV02_010833 [Purpureocillium takamizusanense]UNI14817.1 hypothetical protein JDV02_010833 [Purpureocillium takamizusanense]
MDMGGTPGTRKGSPTTQPARLSWPRPTRRPRQVQLSVLLADAIGWRDGGRNLGPAVELAGGPVPCTGKGRTASRIHDKRWHSSSFASRQSLGRRADLCVSGSLHLFTDNVLRWMLARTGKTEKKVQGIFYIFCLGLPVL